MAYARVPADEVTSATCKLGVALAEIGPKPVEDDSDAQPQKLWALGCRAPLALLPLVALAVVCGLTVQRRPQLPTTSSSVTFVTAETRGAPLLLQANAFSQGFTGNVVNIGEDLAWESYKTKVEIIAKWLRGRLVQAKLEGRKDSDDELIAFVDGSDVVWGGCAFSDFVEAYQRIVKASGARIVFGAEVVCGEQDCNKVPMVPDWAVQLADGRDLNGGFWQLFQEGCHGTWDDECADRRDCGGRAPCSDPPSVKFLNSGFFMGPLMDMTEMMQWAVENYDEMSVWGDQSPLAVYWLEHQDKVTLDYLGELAASLSDLREDFLQVDHKSKQIHNSAFNRTQCLVHGNGRGIWWLKGMVQKLSGRHLKDICEWCVKGTE